MKKKGLSLTLLVLCLIMLGGCGGRPGANGNLTKRQKEILKTHFSDKEFKDLTDEEKEKIICIEEMMQEMDKKYNVDFKYRHYMADSERKTETLIVSIDTEGKNKDYNSIIITRTKDGKNYKYDDTYLDTKLAELSDELFTEDLVKKLKIKDYFVKSRITETDLTKITTKTSDLKGKITGHYIIYLNADEISQTKLEQIKDKFETWMQTNEIYGFANIVVLKGESFKEVTADNYSKYLGKDYSEYKETVYVRKQTEEK